MFYRIGEKKGSLRKEQDESNHKEMDLDRMDLKIRF